MTSLNTFLEETTSVIVGPLDLLWLRSTEAAKLKLEARTVHAELEHRIFFVIKAWSVRHQLMEPLVFEEGLADPTASPILEHVVIDVVTRCVALRASLNAFVHKAEAHYSDGVLTCQRNRGQLLLGLHSTAAIEFLRQLAGAAREMRSTPLALDTIPSPPTSRAATDALNSLWPATSSL